MAKADLVSSGLAVNVTLAGASRMTRHIGGHQYRTSEPNKIQISLDLLVKIDIVTEVTVSVVS